MKILAVIVSYYPDAGLLQKNVASFIDNVDRLLIWENTPPQVAERYRLPYDEKIGYLGEGSNVGISKALNIVRKLAAEQGCDFLLTMDQDSVWAGFDSFVSHLEGNPPFGIYGPVVKGEAPSEPFVETDYLITSGMLVPMAVYDMVGGYDEDFRVDGIDTEFIFRAMSKGVKVYHIGNCLLAQNFGERKKKRFLGKEYTFPGYPASRLFDICRNHEIIFRLYPRYSGFRKRFRRTWYRQVALRIFLGDRDRWQKLTAMMKGFAEGRRIRI